MRKSIVCILMSLDGYVAGPGGNLMLLPLDQSFSAYNLERLKSADTLLLGRNTYEGFVGYWPGVAGDEDQPENEREISRINNGIEKVVVSDSLTEEATGAWLDTTRIVRRAEAHEQIAELRRGDGGDILMFGSATLWNDLLANGLVDELHLMVGNGILVDGVPAFTSPPAGSLTLAEVRQLEGSQNVLMRYAVSS